MSIWASENKFFLNNLKKLKLMLNLDYLIKL